MSTTNQFCTFYVDGLFFGVDVLRVQEVIRFQEMTRVPLASSVVSGLINLRGQIVTVIDRLPPSDNYLEPLEKLLKSRAGSGGTHYNGASGGVIEIQGDKRELIRKILAEKGIPVKG